MLPTTIPPQAARMTARIQLPSRRSRIAAGIQMMKAPRTGTIDNKQPHHQAPKQRRGQTKHPKHQASQAALNCGDGKRSVGDRVDSLGHPPQQVFRLWFCEREPSDDHRPGGQSVAQKIEQEVEGDEHLDHLQQRPLDEGRAEIAEIGRNCGHHRGQIKLPVNPGPKGRKGWMAVYEGLKLAALDTRLKCLDAKSCFCDKAFNHEDRRHDHNRDDNRRREQGGDVWVPNAPFDPFMERYKKDRQCQRPCDGPKERPSDQQTKRDASNTGDGQGQASKTAAAGCTGLGCHRVTEQQVAATATQCLRRGPQEAPAPDRQKPVQAARACRLGLRQCQTAQRCRRQSARRAQRAPRESALTGTLGSGVGQSLTTYLPEMSWRMLAPDRTPRLDRG